MKKTSSNTKKKKKNGTTNGIFMKAIIIYCLLFMAVTNVWSLLILKDTGNNASAIINSINLVHGGELLLCCVKKVLSDMDVKKTKKSDNKESNEIEKISNENLSAVDTIVSDAGELCKSFIENHSGTRGDD